MTDSDKKTIFITMSRGGTARNILQSRCFDILKKTGHRIVIITPAANDDEFLRTFGGKNIFFEEMKELPWRKIDRFIVGIHKSLVYNRSTEFRDLYGIYDSSSGSKLKYWLRRIFIRPFSYIGWLKNFTRFLDRYIAPARYYHHLFVKYKPSLLFATSITEDNDVEVMKCAQEMKVPIIGMPKTWDNASKLNLRVMPDKIIVWGKYSAEELSRYSNIPEKDIVICGIPQFDFYVNPSILLSREEFCRRVGLNPVKKIIVFGSEGNCVNPNDTDIVDIIAKAIERGEILNSQLFVRPHFMFPNDEERFRQFIGRQNVVVDLFYKRNEVFRDNWDYSVEQISHFANIMKHADCLITTASTMSLDAAAVDCPSINIAFDGYSEKDFAHSVARWYLLEHVGSLIDTGAVGLVHRSDELIDSIAIVLRDRTVLHKQRARLAEYFGYKIDGKSGERVANAILSCLTK